MESKYMAERKGQSFILEDFTIAEEVLQINNFILLKTLQKNNK